MSSHIRQARAFASALASPFSPTLCPACFARFVQTVEPENINAPLLHTKCHSFWTALMCFISADWTAERQDGVTGLLQRAHTRCRTCNPAGRPVGLMHDIPEAENAFGLVYQLACLCVHGALINRVNSYKGFGRKPSRWPATEEQLFPHGAEHTVRGLVAQLQQRSFAHALLHNIICYHRPLVFPVLLLPDVRSLVIASILSRLRDCTHTINAALARLSASATPAARQAAAQEHVKTCDVLLVLLYDLVEGRDAQRDDKARFCLGHEVDLFKGVHDFLTMAGNNHLGESYTTGHLASQLWIALTPEQREAVGCAELPTYARDITPIDELDDPYRVLFIYLRNHHAGRACSGPECNATVHDAAARLSLCAGCRITRYCSRACQRADWESALMPHKEVCSALRELRAIDADCQELQPEQFAAVCAEHAFPLARVDVLITWATQGRLSPHFALGGESLYDLVKPLDDLVPVLPADRDAAEPCSKTVYLKIGRQLEYRVTFPPGRDGRTISDREMYKGLSKIKTDMQAKGVPVSWRT